MKKLFVAAVAVLALAMVPKANSQTGSGINTSYAKDSVPPMTKDTSSGKWQKKWTPKDTTMMKSKMDSTQKN